MSDTVAKGNSRFKQYMFVIRQLARKDLRHGNAATALGQLWNIINPFIVMITMALIFSAVFKSQIENFPMYILTGTIIYNLFNSGTIRSLDALVSNKNFLIKTTLPRNIFVIEKIYVSLLDFLYAGIGYIILAIVTGIKPTPFMLLVPLDLGLLVLMIIGFGKILAIINVYFADIKHLYKIVMLLLFYASAIFYTGDRLSPAMQKVLGINPIYVAITIARKCILDGEMPDATLWIKMACFAAFFVIVGGIVFKKGAEKIVQKL